MNPMDAASIRGLIELGGFGFGIAVAWHAMGIFRQLLMEKRWEKTGTKTPRNGYPPEFGPDRVSDRVVYDVSVSLSRLVVGQEQQTKAISELVAEFRSNRENLILHANQTSNFIRAYGKAATGHRVSESDGDLGT